MGVAVGLQLLNDPARDTADAVLEWQAKTVSSHLVVAMTSCCGVDIVGTFRCVPRCAVVDMIGTFP